MAENNVVEVRLGNIEKGLNRLEAAVQKLTEAMVQVARLEVQLAHNGEAVQRAFDAIAAMSERMSHHEQTADSRLKALEEAAPVQKLVSGWILAWIAGAVGLVGGAVAMKVFGL
ncbi:MAG: hypothetical protein HXY24_18805 [Rubrivivax sp.]|nr:hypothetical protein [Rubrivivax sp.]